MLFALLRNLHTLVYPFSSTHEVLQLEVDCRDDAKKRRRKVKAEVRGQFFFGGPLFRRYKRKGSISINQKLAQLDLRHLFFWRWFLSKCFFLVMIFGWMPRASAWDQPKAGQLRRVERTLVEVEDPNPKVGLVGFQWSPFHPTNPKKRARKRAALKKIAREKRVVYVTNGWNLKDGRLMCWCHPLKHGAHVTVEFLENIIHIMNDLSSLVVLNHLQK